MKIYLMLSFILLNIAVSSWAQTKPAPAPTNKTQAAATDASDVPGWRTFAVTLEGLQREFIVYRSNDLDEATKTPIVFVFHGAGGNGEDFLFDSGWQTIADREGITLVLGFALQYHTLEKSQARVFVTQWNDFSLPAKLDPTFSKQKLSDDVKFVQLMLAFVKKNYAVDEARIYATGFANGGDFTTRLAVQLSDTFAAFATTGSVNALTPEHLAATNTYTKAAFKPRPFAHVIGAMDQHLLKDAGVNSFPLDETAVASNSFLYKTTIKAALTALRLKNEFKFQKLSGAASFRYHTSIETDAPHEYDLLIVEGMGHDYPSGGEAGFQIAEVFWNFLKRYRR